MPEQLRRSSRLKELKEQDASIVSTATTQAHLLQLAVEVRLLIYSSLIYSKRPFLIGRVQEEPSGTHNGSPRDIFSSYPGDRKAIRDENRNRPIQPAISRVCRLLRAEVLPLFYEDNEFWLIHNEFQSSMMMTAEERWRTLRREPNTRAFDPWLTQISAGYFKHMLHVTLCGYTCWPTRIMIHLDLKHREVTGVRAYSTYGDEMPFYVVGQALIDTVKQTLSENRNEDALSALRQALLDADSIFQLPQMIQSAPPGLSRTRLPMAGWEYDW